LGDGCGSRLALLPDLLRRGPFLCGVARIKALEVGAQLVADGDLAGRLVPKRARFAALSHFQADRPAQVEPVGKALRDLLEHQDVAEAARQYRVFLALRILDRDRGLRLVGLSQVRRQRLLVEVASSRKFSGLLPTIRQTML